MRTIYVDSESKCHVENDGTMTAVEVEFFDGKCDTFIEGHCCEIHENGYVIYSWKDASLLETAQSLYEETLKDKERITALEEENAMLMECLLEMSEIVYA